MMNARITLLACAVAILASACSSIERSRNLADPAVSGKTLAQQVCSDCHGMDGNPVSPQFPRLAGQQSAYLSAQLTNFRSHQRLDPPGYQYMLGISRHLTDQQIEDMAAYYSAQQPVVAAGAALNTATLPLARQVFNEGDPSRGILACKTCHGANAQGMSTFPRLALQHEDYLIKQLNIFQGNEGRPGTPMETVAHSLSDVEKHALANYLQSFPD